MSNLVLVFGNAAVGKKSALAAVRACSQGGGGGDGGDVLGPWSLDTKYYSAHLSFELEPLAALSQDRLDDAQGTLLVVSLASGNPLADLKTAAAGVDFSAAEPALVLGTHSDMLEDKKNDESVKALSTWAAEQGLEFVAVDCLTEGSAALPNMSLSSDQETVGIPRVVEALQTTPWPDMEMKPRGPSGAPLKPAGAAAARTPSIADDALSKVEKALAGLSPSDSAPPTVAAAASSKGPGFTLTVPPALLAFSPDIASPKANAMMPDLLKGATVVAPEAPAPAPAPVPAPAPSKGLSLSVPPALAAFQPDIASPKMSMPDLLKKDAAKTTPPHDTYVPPEPKPVTAAPSAAAPAPPESSSPSVDDDIVAKFLKEAGGLDALGEMDDLEVAFDALKSLRAQASSLPDAERREVAAKVAMYFWDKMNDGEGEELDLSSLP